MSEPKVKKLNISVKSFIVSLAIIFGLMIVSYVLTFVLPAGEYLRDANGTIVIDAANPTGIYSTTTRDFPFWKFLASPILMFGMDGGITIAGIIVFLLIIGGVFQILFDQGIIEYLLHLIVRKFYNRRYLLLAVLSFSFMALATFAGCFEELIPLIPFVVAIAVSFGWDKFTGIACILISSACGYASGILNPFGTGVAQEVAGIASFSGIWLRIVTFVILYLALVTFLIVHAKKVEKQNKATFKLDDTEFERKPKMNKAIVSLGVLIGLGILVIIFSTFITVLQDFTLYIFAFCFLLGGVVSSIISGVKGKQFFKSFGKGIKSMLPAVVMILLASSIKYILVESNTLDTILHFFIETSVKLPKWSVILFIYGVVLLLELVVPSGTAKAFLLIPLIMPIASVVGIQPNLVILAYIFGDGLANVFYPTNAGLLVGLNIADTDYSSYMKVGWKICLILFAITCGILMFGLAVNYA